MKSFKKYFISAIYAQIIIFIGSLWIADQNLTLPGAFSGKFAIWVFWAIAAAGILQRFRVKGALQKVQLFLMKYRRYLGIIMFNFSFIHFSYVLLYSIFSPYIFFLATTCWLY